MPGNSFGHLLRLTTFGESHGAAIGGILDGVPAGLIISEAEIQHELDLRKPGQGLGTSPRQEADRIQILSGLFEGRTQGTPIGFCIFNTNAHSKDYANLAQVFRPGHADYTYWRKYNSIRDYRGGGRASGRETAARVAAGAIAQKILHQAQINVYAACVEFGGLACAEPRDFTQASSRPFWAATQEIVPAWEELVHKARAAQDTLGGIVEIIAQGVPAGLGEPVFDKLSALLAHALMSVGAVKGVEIGDGFAAARATGSSNNDPLFPDKQGQICFASNHAGGILGGISSGQDIVLRCAVKPIASITKPQNTVDIHGNATSICIQGRHDLSAIPRIVPVLKAMTALVLADCLLQQQLLQSQQVLNLQN
ncbi:MAG: chorismate synthase [Desulfovibrionaceae bacterium]|nr:chorismate synthase [Desulfovibrionaceae bacterium]